MTHLLLLHRPGSDRDALTSYLRKQTFDLEMVETEDALRARIRNLPATTVLLLEGASLTSGRELVGLEKWPVILLGAPAVGPRPAHGLLLDEPYYLPSVPELIERCRKPETAPTRPLNSAPPWAPLVRGLAHALGNPLAGASGWLQLLRADSAVDDRSQLLLRRVQGELDRIEQMARALAVIGGRPGSIHGELDLVALLTTKVAELSREGLAVTLTKGPGVDARVLGDASEFGLFLDLLGASFLEERGLVGPVAWSVTRGKSVLELRVVLGGGGWPLGVDAADLGLLLRDVRYTRALGLALAHFIIQHRLGGSVRLPDDDEPLGALVLEVPLAERSAAEQS